MKLKGVTQKKKVRKGSNIEGQYKLYCKECKKKGVQPCSYATFKRKIG